MKTITIVWKWDCIYFVVAVVLKLNGSEETKLGERVAKYLRLHSSNLPFTDENTGAQKSNVLLKVTHTTAKPGLNHRFTNPRNWELCLFQYEDE